MQSLNNSNEQLQEPNIIELTELFRKLPTPSRRPIIPGQSKDLFSHMRESNRILCRNEKTDKKFNKKRILFFNPPKDGNNSEQGPKNIL